MDGKDYSVRVERMDVIRDSSQIITGVTDNGNEGQLTDFIDIISSPIEASGSGIPTTSKDEDTHSSISKNPEVPKDQHNTDWKSGHYENQSNVHW